MSANDNVIPFPGRWNGSDGDDDTGDHAARLFAEVMRAERHPRPGAPPRDVARHRIRVELDDTDPTVWRMLELPGDTSLARLHEIVQAAMGWTDSHLHQFLMGPAERDNQTAPFLTDFDESEGGAGIHERDVRLDQVLSTAGDRLFYDYDFGDAWEHTLTLEESLHLETDAPRVSCLDGARACPPEDCGGAAGYADLLSALDEPSLADEDTTETLTRLPRGWDPASFSVAQANRVLASTSGPTACT